MLTYILVINKMEQVVQTVASTIDNVEAISRKMVGKECSDDNTYAISGA